MQLTKKAFFQLTLQNVWQLKLAQALVGANTLVSKVKLLQSILGELLHQVLKSLKNMDSQLITLLAFSNLYNQL